MRFRFIALITLGMVLGAAANGQDAGNPPAGGGVPAPGGVMGRGQGRGWGGMMGRGVIGTVTEAGSDHYTIKSELGDTYIIHFNANTRILKQPAQRAGEEGMRTPPQPIKSGDIKAGDVIAANGEVDAEAKSVGAVVVMLIDPERARQMREMEANFGKTWLGGRVTAVSETKITLESPMDHAAHSFMADENTSFHKRRDPITLADIQVGDMVRVEGSIKDGVFMATQVAVMGPPVSGGPVPHPGPPPQ
ncbi:MAG TPA: DUF5666 domain-containing protein [Terracidiphilus sp.]|nr:DUF5666 domain-containing protein [Terracidiphilus sp.]